jgi:hypothetical protein
LEQVYDVAGHQHRQPGFDGLSVDPHIGRDLLVVQLLACEGCGQLQEGVELVLVPYVDYLGNIAVYVGLDVIGVEFVGPQLRFRFRLGVIPRMTLL